MIPIILFCVFDLSPNTPVNRQQVHIQVTKKEYNTMKYEDGNVAKHRQCKRVYRRNADLAWFEDDVQ